MRLELTIGMIASGKSTYAKERAKEGALVVSHDDLTEMLHAEYRYEQGLRDLYREIEETVVYQIIFASKDAVVDRTHLTRESRKRWIDFANHCRMDFRSPDFSLEVIAVTFPIEEPLVHADRRFAEDPRGRTHADWYYVARHHHAQSVAEPLDWKAEGFDGFEARRYEHPGRTVLDT